MVSDRLKELVAQSGKSQQEIADEGGLSLATVNKVLNGATANPSLDTLVRILQAIGKGLGDLEPGFADAKDAEQMSTLLKDMLVETKQRVADLETERKQLNVHITLLSTVVILLMAVLSAILIIDSINLDVGLIQHQNNGLAVAAVIAVFVLLACGGYLVYMRLRWWLNNK